MFSSFRQQYRPVDSDPEANGSSDGPSKKRIGLPNLTRRSLIWIVVVVLIVAVIGFGSKPAKKKWEAFQYPSSWDDPKESMPEGSLIPPVENPAEVPTSRPSKPTTSSGGIDWSQFAYVQYVTNQEYLCNSVMLFEILHRLGAKAEKVMMYPDSMHYDRTDNSKEAELLLKARDQYNVRLKPISVITRTGGDSTWAESYTKLLAFNQTEYKRVLMLDSDSTVLQPMDELFIMPSAPVAMPRAYWDPKREKILSSQLLLVEPSAHEYERVDKAISSAAPSDFDMEIVNNLYYESCLILPHRPYDLLTGEFRSDNHTAYLGDPTLEWDPDAALKEAKFLHFSDWPVPKPWLSASPSVIDREQPKCVQKNGKENCRNRELWLGFYDDFKKRRSQVCGMNRRRATKRDIGYPPLDEPVFGQI